MHWRARFVPLCLSLAIASVPCAAQRTVHSAMIWTAAFGDQPVAEKTAVTWDVQLRRADFGANWQLILGSLGIARELSPSWKATAALGWSHQYRYGAFPARANSFELRPFVQIAGTRKLASWTWSDRVRTEFRLLHPIGDDAPPDADWMKTVVRLRRLDRFQHALTDRSAWYAVFNQELFVNVAPPASRVAMLEQLRHQALIGHQVSTHNRVEVGYGLQTFNRTGGYELNHTLIMNLRTSVPLR